MKNTPYINLRKAREFGDVFNDTFAFLKQEAKPLFNSILLFALPFLLISSIGVAYVQATQRNYLTPGLDFNFFDYFSKMALIILFALIGQMMLMLTVYSYCKLYVEKGAGNFSNNDIFVEIRKSFFPCLGAVIILAIVVVFGTAMCLVPGIYLGVSLSMVLPIMIIESKGFGVSFSRSFDLTHKQWWWTFLILFVYVIMYYIFAIILSLPGLIFGITKLFEMGSTEGFSIPTYLIIYNAIIGLVGTLITVVLHIAIVLQYFNITELFEGQTLSHRIDQISQNDQI